MRRSAAGKLADGRHQDHCAGANDALAEARPVASGIIEVVTNPEARDDSGYDVRQDLVTSLTFS